MASPKTPVSVPTPPDIGVGDDPGAPPERFEPQEDAVGDDRQPEILKMLQLVLEKLDRLHLQTQVSYPSCEPTPSADVNHHTILDSCIQKELPNESELSTSISKVVLESQESDSSEEPSGINIFQTMKFSGMTFLAATGSLADIAPGLLCLNTVRIHMRELYKKQWFEPLMVSLIFLNAICMIAELQYDGIQLSRRLQFNGAEGHPHNPPSKVLTFKGLEWLFGSLFALELVFKLIVKGAKFFKSAFDWIDVITVCSFLFETMVIVIDPLSFASLRMFRFVRVFRLVRLVRTIEHFDHLYLMTTAIKASVSVLAWAFLLLVTILMFVALALSQCLHFFYFRTANENGDYVMIDIASKTEQEVEHIHMMYEYFGTWTRAMLSVFEITLANWSPICRMLTEEVSGWFGVVILMHKLTVGFAVVGVINGVFMQETFRPSSFSRVFKRFLSKQLGIILRSIKGRSYDDPKNHLENKEM